jgi:3-hydroxybutyryl-CoA dehydrogenase
VALWDFDAGALAAAVARADGDRPGAARAASSLADAVAGADVIVEALPERLELKRAFLAEVDRLDTTAIVTTNTSVIRITDIAAESDLAHRVVGTHWWNPPHLINVVEVAGGDRTDPAVRARIADHLTAIGKDVVIVDRDVSGFIGNRMQFALMREALSMLEEGVADAATIDHVARQTFGRRLAAMGPIEQADYIGLDLTRSIMSYLLPSLNADPAPPALLDAAIESGAVGAKAGRGLISWPDGARETARVRLESHLLDSGS